MTTNEEDDEARRERGWECMEKALTLLFERNSTKMAVMFNTTRRGRVLRILVDEDDRDGQRMVWMKKNSAMYDRLRTL